MQNALTVIVPIKPGEAGTLETFLNRIGDDIKNNPHVRFAQLPMIHFARWVILPDAARPDAASLAFGTDHDGDDDVLLQALFEHAAPALATIYGHCVGSPADIAGNAAAFKQYMKAHAVRYAARHVAYHGYTVGQIRNDLAVRERIEDFLDDQTNRRTFARLTPAQVRDQIRTFLKQEQAEGSGLSTRLSPVTRDGGLVALLVGLASVVLVLILVAPRVLGTLLVLFLLYVIALAASERRDARQPQPPAPALAELTRLVAREDYRVQNQMTHVVPIKPGWLRQTTLRTVLGGINLLARIHYNKGKLGNIPTIHFARWMRIENGRRLLFFSNFDGSWENYLGDFVDKASVGLTGVWSNTVGFPPSRLLFGEGARDIEPFKAWTRRHQVPTQVWYSAHPNHTVVNLLNAAAIRDGVERQLDAPAIEAWLRRL